MFTENHTLQYDIVYMYIVYTQLSYVIIPVQCFIISIHDMKPECLLYKGCMTVNPYLNMVVNSATVHVAVHCVQLGTTYQ